MTQLMSQYHINVDHALGGMYVDLALWWDSREVVHIETESQMAAPTGVEPITQPFQPTSIDWGRN